MFMECVWRDMLKQTTGMVCSDPEPFLATNAFFMFLLIEKCNVTRTPRDCSLQYCSCSRAPSLFPAYSLLASMSYPTYCSLTFSQRH